MSNLYNQPGQNLSNRYAPPPPGGPGGTGTSPNQFGPPTNSNNPNIPSQYNQNRINNNINSNNSSNISNINTNPNPATTGAYGAPPSQYSTPATYAPPGQSRPPSTTTNQGYGAPPPTFTQQPVYQQPAPQNFPPQQFGPPGGGFQQGPPTGGFQSPPPPPPSLSSGPPSSGGSGGGIRPPPKSNVQFFSVGGGNATPVPAPSTSFGAMPPPPSNITSPPPISSGPPPPIMSGPPSDLQHPPSPGGQSFQGYPPPGQQQFAPGQQQFVPPGPGSGHGFPQQDPNAFVAPPYNPMAGMPLGFDSGTYGQPGPSIDPNGANTPQILPGIEEMDLSIQCDPSFLRASVGKIVNSQALASQSRVPLGVVCRPMAGDVGTENDLVEVVDFGSTGIVRCKRCRTYINPFVSWVDNGRRWRCNICGMLNDVPTSYFSHLDQNGQRRDKDQRPELSRCSVEFVAPGDYMVRPPQPPVYFFVIDVTSSASSSGMLRSCVNAIKKSLDNLPGNPRTQIGE